MTNRRRLDPQQLGKTRKRYVKDMASRFGKIRDAVVDVVHTRDFFGIAPRDTPQRQLDRLFLNQEWAALDDAGKVEAFKAWLQEQIDNGILTQEAGWQTEYLRYAHSRGLESTIEVDLGAGALSQAQINVVQPLASAELLYKRAFDALEGVTSHMSNQLSRILTEGFVKGQHSRVIADTMVREIGSITRRRAIVLAHTELARVYAEAQLDGFERDGKIEIELFAEWSTAGDDRVCPLCQPLDGQIMTIDEARGLIPLHPMCRCAWIPVTNRRNIR